IQVSIPLLFLLVTMARTRRAISILRAELLCILCCQSLPAFELHHLAASDAADGSSSQKPVQNIERNVPTCRAPRNEAAIDVVPQHEACAAANVFELPADIAVLKNIRHIGSRHR